MATKNVQSGTRARSLGDSTKTIKRKKTAAKKTRQRLPRDGDEPNLVSMVEGSDHENEDIAMNQDRVTGTARNIGGQVEEGYGRVTGDVQSQVEGRMKQAAGAAQDLYGQARDAAGEAARAVQQRAAPLEEALRNTIENRPYTAVLIALAIGWMLGRMSRPGW